MPHRSVISLFSRNLRHRSRHFHTSRVLYQGKASGDSVDGKNYYEILEVPTNASAAEIKKSFYHLSKTHHPDHNPDDPTASTRFVAISTAYTTLSNPTSRNLYDQTTLPSSSSTSHPRTHPQGSHFSPAGGRPASGLSRRRAQFRGPPPSFYRSGGWGEQSAKRKNAHENTQNSHSQKQTHTTYTYDPSESPPHFDAQTHLSTQKAQDQRRRERLQRMEDEKALRMSPGPSTLAMLFLLSGIIGGVSSLGFVWS